MATAAITTVQFRCKKCRTTHKVPARLAGSELRCTGCQASMRVPDTSSSSGSGSGSGSGQRRRAALFKELPLFHHTSGAGKHKKTVLLAVESEAIRVLEWDPARLDAKSAGSTLLERAEKVKKSDVRIAFSRISRVARCHRGGLIVEFAPVRDQTGTLTIPLGEEPANRAVAHLDDVLPGFRARLEPVPFAELAALPGIAALVAVGVGALCHPFATSLQATSLNAPRKGGMFVSALQALGPNGVLMLAAAIVVAAGLALASRLQHTPKVAVLARA